MGEIVGLDYVSICVGFRRVVSLSGPNIDITSYTLSVELEYIYFKSLKISQDLGYTTAVASIIFSVLGIASYTVWYNLPHPSLFTPWFSWLK